MNHIYVSVICALSITLSACEKKPLESNSDKIITTTTVALSVNNIEDIKHDITLFENVINAPEVFELEDEMRQQLDDEGKDSIPKVFQHMKKIMQDRKDKLDNTQFKSSEVSKIKDKFKETIEISIKIADKASKMKLDEDGRPVDLDDLEEINDLKAKSDEILEEMRTEFQLIQTNAQKSEHQ